MPLIPIFQQGLTPELIKIAEDELGENDEIRNKGIKELKRLIKEEPDFNPCTDDAFLVKFLRGKKYNVERAFKTLKNYYVYKAQNSGVLTDIRPSYFLAKINSVEASVLQYRDQNQCAVGLIRLGQINDDKLSPSEVLAIVLLATEVVLEFETTQIAGYSLIVDLAGFNLLKARRYASPFFLHKMVSAIQDCYPGRIKGFHFVNEPFYFDIIYTTLYPFLSEKLKKRFHLHGTNLENLHKYISSKILPEELGGEQGPADINEKKSFEIVMESEDHFVRINKFGYTGKTLQKLTKGNTKAVSN